LVPVKLTAMVDAGSYTKQKQRRVQNRGRTKGKSEREDGEESHRSVYYPRMTPSFSMRKDGAERQDQGV